MSTPSRQARSTRLSRGEYAENWTMAEDLLGR
jgi:hypothetical protein